MSDSTTPHPWRSALTLRRIAPVGTRPYHRYGLRPPATPGSVTTDPTGTGLVESPI